ncbi:AraC family transcriptional regulator [Amycolatopsis regifaucium]|uniref:AraC family transcriptional regulator n=1 Tax=Amycolatopsis regifaucium TaxID=546365 RepID=A0A154M457_9PSEU|nr:helix-turn-helix domain-containing protein [Amycolatopsis regifaucium]KZB79157.1 AraC family transcriptional regulator [Amycolatopsis regifaucium]OKA07340.1 AraC family transcriptional regulator [Amycolatopsis regifaucium]SFH13900.1 AraC family transcriptional regulator [Amycolatopsis regifaucium]
MVFRSERFDLQPYVGFDMARYVRRTYCSWEDSGWQSLLVQRFDHVPVAEDMEMPATADLHLVLPASGRAVMETRGEGRWNRSDWRPGRLTLAVPGKRVLHRYRGDESMRSLQVHIPGTTVESIATRLGGRAVDHEAMAASLTEGDPLLGELVRALGNASEEDDLYAESAAAFLTVHLLTRHALKPSPPRAGREDARVRAAVAMMRERLADPLSLADIAGGVHLSVYHFIRVFKEKTGETPHRFLARLRLEEAQRLLRDTDLSVARIARRCGFATPGALSAAFLRHTGVRPSDYRNS